MGANAGYSCTSNTVKLYKHMDTLIQLQKGIVVPIMLHIVPTHKCNMNCDYCCFKNRKDRQLDLPLEVLKKGIWNFYRLGTRSIEFTGGGDPSLYPHIDEVLQWARVVLGMNIGFITNTVASKIVKNWKYCSWVRVSLNTLDYYDSMNIDYIKDSGTYVSGCYIWNERTTPDVFEKVVKFAEKEKIVCRVAPDCIKPGREINQSVRMLTEVFEEYKDSKYVFLSDFNIVTDRPNLDCRIHMIKPCFYVDGYIYSCPSAELAYENNRALPESIRLCKYDEVLHFYADEAKNATFRSCSYCKYAGQQVVLEEVLAETAFNEFA